MKRLRNLSNTAFSTDRLFVWAVGVVLVISVSGIVALSLTDRPIPPQLQSLAMFSLGAFVSMITRQANIEPPP